MRLFRKTIELDEKGMNEFISSVSEGNSPRYKKREELITDAGKSSYWDTLAKEREDLRRELFFADPDDDNDDDDMPRREHSSGRGSERGGSQRSKADTGRLDREADAYERDEVDDNEYEDVEFDEIGDADETSGKRAEEFSSVEEAMGESEKADNAKETKSSKGFGFFKPRAKATSNAIQTFSKRELKNVSQQKCETISDSRMELGLLRAEYQEVTLYIQDTQLIERLDESEEQEVAETARHILSIKKDMDRLGKKRRNLTDYQTSAMDRYQDVIKKDIRKLEEDEEMSALIKGDLQKLEEEKGELSYEKEKELARCEFIKKMAIISGVVVGLLFVLYLVLFMATELDVVPEFLITVGCAAALVFYLLVENRRNRYALAMNDKKMNRLVTLNNKVKIKYVNNTATLDYMYDKYGVSSVKELRSRWEQYVSLMDDYSHQQKSLEALHVYEVELTSFLRRLGVHDPEVWIYQCGALTDHKEMVELKHRLNARRSKLRERIDYNQKVIDESMEYLRKLVENNAEFANDVNDVLKSYEIAL